MRVNIKFEDKCLVIPSKDGRESVKWLISEAVRRFNALNGAAGTSQFSDDVSWCLCVPNGGGMLYFSDAIEDVLENDGFAELKSELLLRVGSFFI